jgi:hypothetical protein
MCVIPRRAASVIAAKISTGDRRSRAGGPRAGERARADEQ